MILLDFYQINLFVHLVAVSLWLGLTVNFSLLMVPLIRDLPDQVAKEHMKFIGNRARKTVSILILILLITGLINLHRVGLLNFSETWTSTYGLVAMAKVSLAMLLFLAFPFIFIMVHRYGSDQLSARITRMNYLHWSITTVTLIIMFLGTMLRG